MMTHAYHLRKWCSEDGKLHSQQNNVYVYSSIERVLHGLIAVSEIGSDVNIDDLRFNTSSYFGLNMRKFSRYLSLTSVIVHHVMIDRGEKNPNRQDGTSIMVDVSDVCCQ